MSEEIREFNIKVDRVLQGGFSLVCTNEEDWPDTVNKAVEIVYKPLSNDFKLDFTSESKEKTLAQFHFTMGRRIRNMFGLWQDNEALKDNAYFHYAAKHPDDISHIIMSKIYDKCLRYTRYRRRHGSPICKTEGCGYASRSTKCEYCNKPKE